MRSGRTNLELAEMAVGEVGGLNLADRRLNGRAVKIARSVAVEPAAGFPSIMNEAELEGFYRFVGNERVGFESVMESHVERTVQRMAECEEVVVAHDTTAFCFGGETSREGLGRLQKKGGQGFMGHFALAVSADAKRDPLGVLGVLPVVRGEESATRRRKSGLGFKGTVGQATEQDKWWQLIELVEKKIDRPGAWIHVLDREADDYALLSRLVQANRRFVVRLCYDRRLDPEATGSAPGQKTKEYVASRPVRCERSVHISRRGKKGPAKNKVRHPARPERVARLGVSAVPVVMKAPSYHRNSALLARISLYVVHVRELHPPAEAEPVGWFLLTTEPVETEEEILKVVDLYRTRWRIEEYFKALKTGCAYEKRQLESLPALLNTLALLVPIAWGLLRLRTTARDDSKNPASETLSPTQITILRRTSKKRLPPNLSVHRAMLAVALLGGHLKRNGPPGWQVLGRGYQKLLMLEEGFLLR